MCRSQAEGGQRCSRSAHHRVMARAQASIRATLDEVGEEWGGQFQLELSSPVIAKAYDLAIQAHAYVRRTSGEAYINHPLRVAISLQSRGFSDEVVAIGILHDAVEDSDLTFDSLRRRGFSEFVVSGVESVTKREGEQYLDAVHRAAAHPGGRLVKLADTSDNSSPEQLAPLPEAKRQRVTVKYAAAQEILHAAIDNAKSENYTLTVSADKVSDYFA